ncbi:hypothetical protein CRE_21799 [Caenorhabditis remanei]|uniref:Uncharacterized protein n=1 Tax=Caenorhabditis remanei TaxID=31234 RepID=E3MEJ4_CAERE|nr:hypothetical protein CRE_21799 [Caenorhabditis remanei]
MATILRIGIVQLVCALLVSSQVFKPQPKVPGKGPTIPIDRIGATIQDRQKFVEMINYFRLKASEIFQIANMCEVSWDADLEKKAEQQTCDMRPGPNYMVSQVQEKKDLVKNWKETEDKGKDEFLLLAFTTFLEPEQTKIGCALLQTPCPGPISDVKVSCLIGPLNSPRDSAKGAPGSKCRNGKAASGLCNVSPSLSSASLTLLLVAVMYLL